MLLLYFLPFKIHQEYAIHRSQLIIPFITLLSLSKGRQRGSREPCLQNASDSQKLDK